MSKRGSSSESESKAVIWLVEQMHLKENGVAHAETAWVVADGEGVEKALTELHDNPPKGSDITINLVSIFSIEDFKKAILK